MTARACGSRSRWKKELGFETKRDIEEYGLDKFTDKCIERVVRAQQRHQEPVQAPGPVDGLGQQYYTYKDNNITSIWAVLKKCDENGWIKQVYKPMPWCPPFAASLSEHEMSGSYKEVEHIAVFFKVPLVEKDAYMLVWTTTPGPLTANAALAVNPELDYVMARLDGEEHPIIMGRTYFENKFAKKGEVLESFKGTDLAGLHYETCFPELELQKDTDHRVVLWDEVQDDEGCGVVHIAPAAAPRTLSWAKEGIDVLIPIDEYGVLLPSCGMFAAKGAVRPGTRSSKN